VNNTRALLRKNMIVITTNGVYLWSFVIQIFLKGLPSHGGDLKIFEMMTTT